MSGARSHLILLLALGGGLLPPIAASNVSETDLPKNGSDIRVIDPEEEEDFVLLCAGLRKYGHELITIGLRDADLQSAIPCVPGDFDGNGYFDFAIWGPLRQPDPDLPGTRYFKVLYFAEGLILKSQQLETPECDHLWLFGARDEEGENGEPINPHDGLLQLGEGETVYYYVYDDERGILKRIEWPETDPDPEDQ